MINVVEFGVVPDGYTCCVPTIEMLIKTRIPDGGVLYFPPGKYALSREISVNRKSISFQGSGCGSSQFLSSNTEQSYIVFGSDGVQCSNFFVKDLGFNALSSRIDGSYLHFRNVFNATISNCLFANGFISINLENAFFTRVDDCMIIDPVPRVGIGVLVHGNKRHNDQYLSRVFVQSQDQSPPAACGFRLANSQGLWMQECGSYRCSVGFHLLATAGLTAEHFFLSRNHADNCATDGWLLEAGTQSTLRRIQFNGDWSSSNKNSGWMLNNSGGTIADISLLNARAYQNGGPAIFGRAFESFDIQNPTFAGNCANLNVPAEIVLDKKINHLRIQGGRIGGLSGQPAHAMHMVHGLGFVRDFDVSENTGFGLVSLCEDPETEERLRSKNKLVSGE